MKHLNPRNGQTMKMINVLMLMTLILSFSQISNVFAHSTHHHAKPKEISAEAVKAKATDEVLRLIGSKKIAETWKESKLLSAEQKKFKKGTEWVVTYQNEKESDKKKKTLYVFLNLYGDFIAANFTGN